MSAMELDPSSVRLDQLLVMCAALHLELQVQTQAAHSKSSNAANVQEW